LGLGGGAVAPVFTTEMLLVVSVLQQMDLLDCPHHSGYHPPGILDHVRDYVAGTRYRL
jgi:hypothetical protein